ncbi:hypothetical protein [Salmonella phage SD-1_S14]|nr:hypothetical protein [Salmonella phage SD-1_S14]
MQIIILIVGIMLYCSSDVFQNGEKPKESIGKKLDKVLDVINE